MNTLCQTNQNTAFIRVGCSNKQLNVHSHMPGDSRKYPQNTPFVKIYIPLLNFQCHA